MRIEAEESDDTDFKQEQDVTLDIVPRIKVIKEVNDSVLIHGLGHKSWQLFYFVDICERITNVYVSWGMSACIVCMQNNRWLCDSWYISHFPTGLVSSKIRKVAMTFAPTYI